MAMDLEEIKDWQKVSWGKKYVDGSLGIDTHCKSTVFCVNVHQSAFTAEETSSNQSGQNNNQWTK